MNGIIGVRLAAMAALVAITGSSAHAAATAPKIDKTQPVQLQYPVAAQRNGEQGTVDFQLEVDQDGKPTGRMRMVKSSGFADLDDAAVGSALNWRYTPAFDAGGSSVTGWAPVHIVYKLPKPPAAPATAKPPQS